MLTLVSALVFAGPRAIKGHGSASAITSLDGDGNGTFVGTFTDTGGSAANHPWYTFNANIGNTVTINLASDVPSYIWVFDVLDNNAMVGDAVGIDIIAAANMGGDVANILNFVAPSTGQFVIQVDSFFGAATVNYTLLISGAIAEADLSLTKVAVGAPAAPLLGDVFNYVLEVSNAGPSDATNVVVTDTLPPELAFVGSDCGMVEGPPGVLTWSVGTLVAGAMASCTLTVEVVNFSDLLINTASADSDATDTNTGNNSAGSQENGAIPTIPTLGPLGLFVLLLALASVGGWRLRRS